ncbi:hypothetical protein EW026_g6727 [Hermanssonia centrifuga]|uniref:DUF6533 domain-containing protein n=1 Tax=Hermanssonia centrifuga TaxID=98765 RepID=A0A4S4KA32_9APHY|nr:hypothetical protein EW026_g6727 [Hermanssonia centrifuga]
MSQASSDPGAIVAAFQADLDFSFQSCMVALVAYEYILTVNQEVAMIWRRSYNMGGFAFHSSVSLGTHLALIAADVLVLALTWNRTFTHRMAAIRVGVQTPLSAMLLRDGTVYFVVLLAINLTDVIGNTVPSLQATSAVTSNLIGTLTPILISRFLLNLRQLGEPENETQSRFNSRFSIPGFRVPTLESIVGNMGADLDYGPAEEVDNEAGEADMPVDGGGAEVSVLDATTEDDSGGLVPESV